MGAPIPEISRARFEQRLLRGLESSGAEIEVGPEVVDRLYVHFQELRRWNLRTSLVGPGTVSALVERHYVESLAALPLLGPETETVVDIGSGAGFPGFVLAAARPALAVTLLEPNARKAVFLRHAAARAALSCRCLGARVGARLADETPRDVDLVTVRALRLDRSIWRGIDQILAPKGRVLYWRGVREPDVAGGWEQVGNQRLAQRSSTIDEFVRSELRAP